MQVQRIETTDIFKSAVFLGNGGCLAGVYRSGVEAW